MGWFNQVQALRKRIGLSQRDLALRARTSQQQVQRIESGIQAPRIGLALRLAQALGQPLEQVFPLPAPPSRPPAAADDVDAAGLGWTLSFRLQGGAAGRLRVAAAEVGRLRRDIGAAAAPGRFTVLRGRHHEVALRLDRLSLAQLHSGLLPDEGAERDFPPGQAILFLAGDPVPMIFPPEPDEAALEATEAEEDAGACPNQGLLAALDLGAFEPRDRFVVVDARNGEAIHLLARDLALLAMPFDALSPPALLSPRPSRWADNDA